MQFLQLIWALALGLAAGSASSEVIVKPELSLPCSEARQCALDAIVAGKLDFYRTRFPQIEFAVLDARKEPDQEMARLFRLLGRDAVNLDYEHLPELRADLLEVSLVRVHAHLRDSNSSSAIFRVGTNSELRRPLLCVLTLNVSDVARDNQQATRHMLDLPAVVLERLPRTRYLDADQHLEFVIDHEIHHCLMVHRGEPIPMSRRKFWADYMQRRNEGGADAFGLAMHVMRHGGNSNYATTLANIRGLSLLLGDPDHFTPSALCKVREIVESDDKHEQDVERALVVSTHVRDSLDLGYEEYLKYRYAAYQAMNHLGLADVIGPAVLSELPDYEPDFVRAEILLRHTLAHYRNLFGNPAELVAH